MTEVRLFREEINSYRYLSLDEMDLLLEGASEHLSPILITALNTGMRLGEILGLHWDDIDFDHEVITVRHTKNKEYRKIPMNSRLTKTLTEIKINGGCGDYVFSHEDGLPRQDLQ